MTAAYSLLLIMMLVYPIQTMFYSAYSIYCYHYLSLWPVVQIVYIYLPILMKTTPIKQQPKHKRFNFQFQLLLFRKPSLCQFPQQLHRSPTSIKYSNSIPKIIHQSHDHLFFLRICLFLFHFYFTRYLLN